MNSLMISFLGVGLVACGQPTTALEVHDDRPIVVQVQPELAEEALAAAEFWELHGRVPVRLQLELVSEPDPKGHRILLVDADVVECGAGIIADTCTEYWPDNGTRPRTIWIAKGQPRWDWLLKHEMGHFFGLSHCEDHRGVMTNSSWKNQIGDCERGQVQDLYY